MNVDIKSIVQKETKNGLYYFVGTLYQYILCLMYYGFMSCLLIFGLLYCFRGYAYFRLGECDDMERGSSLFSTSIVFRESSEEERDKESREGVSFAKCVLF